MANTDKKNEYDKIQAINNFVKDVASPLANNIKSLKSKLNRISDNLTKKRSELKSLEKAETVKKDVALENAEVISDPVETKEPIVESVAARPEEVVSSNDGGDVVISAKKETAEVVKPIEKPRETAENTLAFRETGDRSREATLREITGIPLWAAIREAISREETGTVSTEDRLITITRTVRTDAAECSRDVLSTKAEPTATVRWARVLILTEISVLTALSSKSLWAEVSAERSSRL